MKKIIIAVLVLSGSLSLVAQQKEDMNLKGEKSRIKQGRKSGEITNRELKKINEEKRDVKEAVREAKADGIVTNDERKEISKEDRQLDRTIQRTKHNARKRK